VLPRPTIVSYLRAITEEVEQDVLSHQIALLSVNVLRKHRWVNRGWILAASGIVLLAASGALQVATL
jgi:hypothetical protein